MSHPRQQSIAMIIWVVSLVALIITYGLTLLPKQQQLRRLQQEMLVHQQTLESLQQLGSPLAREKYQERLQQIKEQSESLIFDREQLNKFDFKVRELASQAGLVQFNSRNQFKKTTPTQPRDTALGQQQISMSAKCDFPGFLQFVNDLERHHPAAFITGFKLSQNFDKTNAPLPSAILDVSLWCD